MSRIGVKLHLIGGEWVEGADTVRNINPSDLDDVVGEFSFASAVESRLAVDAAKRAFADWRTVSIQHRFDILDAAGAELLARHRELGELLAREEGKILSEAIAEVTRAGQIFKFFAGEALRVEGEFQRSVRADVEIAVTREPLGVIAVITPWNFPIAIPAWKIAAALAYGNCVVFKPAELTPASAWALVDILHRSGAPAGVVNLVMGDGGVGQSLVGDSEVNAVSFTGAAETGAKIAAQCAARGAKYQLEMGGKNPLLVLADADLDQAVSIALNGAFFSTGQRCTASSRILVEGAAHDAFVEKILARTRALKVGHALDSASEMGPVADQRQLTKNLAYIDCGKAEGAELLCGGIRLERDTCGYFLAPALFAAVSNDMRIAQEEIFGPVAAIIRVDDFEAGLAAANDTRFGLSAGVCTRSLRYAGEFRRRVNAGMVMINLPTAGVDYHTPFGGTKASSSGSREQGRYAGEFFTSVKTSYLGGA